MARESGGEGAKSSGNPSEKARALPAQLFASRAPELAPREPGRGGTVAPGVSPWPGPGGSFARAEPGSVADPGYQTCGDCMRPAWLALLQATKHTLRDGSPKSAMDSHLCLLLPLVTEYCIPVPLGVNENHLLLVMEDCETVSASLSP